MAIWRTWQKETGIELKKAGIKWKQTANELKKLTLIWKTRGNRQKKTGINGREIASLQIVVTPSIPGHFERLERARANWQEIDVCRSSDLLQHSNGRLFSFISSFIFIFSNKQYVQQFLQQIYVTKCTSSILRWDANPRPSEDESPPITTRPDRLPPFSKNFRRMMFNFFCWGGGVDPKFHWKSPWPKPPQTLTELHFWIMSSQLYGLNELFVPYF